VVAGPLQYRLVNASLRRFVALAALVGIAELND